MNIMNAVKLQSQKDLLSVCHVLYCHGWLDIKKSII